MPGQIRKIASNAFTIGGATLLSRILGFVRDLIIAFALGAGPLADAFFVAFRIPNLLRRLFAEGSLTLAFVPVFTRTRQESGKKEAFVLARSTMAWLILILSILTIFALIFAGPITWMIAPGFKQDSDLFVYTVQLVRICFPYILFISAVALCMGILNSMGRFLAPALAPCILNLILIASALGAVFFGWSVPTALAIGVLMAGAGQVMLQLPFLKAEGFTWKGSWSLKNKQVQRVGLLMLPTVLGAAVYQLNIVLNTVLASWLPKGSISYLYYADRLVQFPLGIFGIAVSTAALPNFSSLLAQKRYDEFAKTLDSTLRLLFFISLPAAAGLIGLRVPLVEVLFNRGAFEIMAAQATAAALAGYSLGLPAFCWVRSLVSAYYAFEDTKTPVKIAIFCLFLNLALGLFLMQFWEHVGLALAVSLASWANVLLLGFFLKKRIKGWFSLDKGLTFVLLSSLVMGFGSAWSARSWGDWALLTIPVWIFLYFVSAWLLNIPEARILLKAAKR